MYGGFLLYCFCCCRYIFRKIRIFSEGFFPLVFAISLATVKTDVKIFSKMSFFFPELVCRFFSFFGLGHLPTTFYSCTLLLKQKIVHCVLCFWLVCIMLGSYMLRGGYRVRQVRELTYFSFNRHNDVFIKCFKQVPIGKLW